MTDPELSAIFSLAGTTGANLRLALMDDDDKTAMTAKAREVKARNYFERLKKIVDPKEEYDDEERTRRATNLLKARKAKAELDAARRERRRRLLTDPLDELTSAEAS